MRRTPLASVFVLTACIGEPVFVGSQGGGGGGTGGGGTTSSTTSASSSTSTGEAGATTTGPMTECGNWQVEVGEECEDGNDFPGDGCSPECLLEAFCGNDVVEPGEKCDGVECDAMCEPLPTSACASGIELAFGATDFVAGMPISSWGFCSTSEPARFVGWYDTGPLPMRLAVRYLGTSEQYKLGIGCQQMPLTMCDGTEVTATLPPHSIVWLTAFTPAEGDMRKLHVFQTRFGSWFQSGGDGLVDQGAMFTWTWSTNNNGQWAVSADGPGQGILISPPVDLSGIETAAVHFSTNLQEGGGAIGRVDFSIDDGMTWTVAGSAPAGNNDQFELPLLGAEGRPGVLIRFTFEGQTASSWSIQNLFVGPPVPM
jgi:cysteine-rich repeat protein